MNVQRLIEKYKRLEGVWDAPGAEIARQIFLQDLEQLDEPEKVKVPQCVHKYIQEAKEYNWDLQDLMKSIDDEDSEELQRWFYHECNQETLARAWIFGYEVEKEKLYLVKVKGVNEECEYLFFGELSNTWKFRSLGSFGELKKHHTRKELEEANFGWVFDCPGIEIEEVE